VSFPFLGEGLEFSRLQPFAVSRNQGFDRAPLNQPLKEAFKGMTFQGVASIALFDVGHLNQAFENVIDAKGLKDSFAGDSVQKVAANTPLEGPVTGKPLHSAGRNRPYKKPTTPNLRIL
jgi:hypothetical protein